MGSEDQKDNASTGAVARRRDPDTAGKDQPKSQLEIAQIPRVPTISRRDTSWGASLGGVEGLGFFQHCGAARICLAYASRRAFSFFLFLFLFYFIFYFFFYFLDGGAVRWNGLCLSLSISGRMGKTLAHNLAPLHARSEILAQEPVTCFASPTNYLLSKLEIHRREKKKNLLILT